MEEHIQREAELTEGILFVIQECCEKSPKLSVNQVSGVLESIKFLILREAEEKQEDNPFGLN